MNVVNIEEKWEWAKNAPWSGCGEGWCNILDEFFQNVKNILDFFNIPYNCFTISQYKEKFGVLRLYWNLVNKDDEGNQLYLDEVLNTACNQISKALYITTTESGRTCEVCGEPGELTGKYWLQTLCKKHEK